jgi:CheY-like chemotaxis protein
MLPVLLIVDDEPITRMDLADLGQCIGFRTVEAETADEALAILEKYSDISVVLTDIRMPGTLDGLDLAHVVRDRWPPKAVIICSGEVMPEDKNLPCGVAFLSKPFAGQHIEDVLQNVRAELH